MIRRVMGDEWLRDSICDMFRARPASPTDIHKTLARLAGDCFFLTTNYDQLLEDALEQATGRRPRVVTPEDTKALAEWDAEAVMKLHGDLDRPQTIVLTIKDYQRLSHYEPTAWQERLKSLIQQGRLLLVGYSYRDPDIIHVVNELNAAYQGHLPKPYWLERISFPVDTWAEEHSLQTIPGIDEYVQIIPWLDELVRQIEAQKRKAPMVLLADAYAGAVYRGFEKQDAIA